MEIQRCLQILKIVKINIIHDLIIFAGDVKAYERIWLVGDGFMLDSYTQYFANAFGDSGQTDYIRAHYDASGLFHGKDKLNTSILSRICNAFIKAINDQILFPKAVLIILEQDFITELKHCETGFSTVVGKAIEYISNQFHRIITSHKERLPSKSRKFKFPTVLWTTMPSHYDWRDMNQFRSKFNEAVKITSSLFREFDILELQWDDCDRTYFTKGRLNAKGLTVYWQIVNAAFEQWDRNQMKLGKGLGCGGKTGIGGKNNKKFKEKTLDEKKFQWKPEKTRFKLPVYNK